MDTNSSLNSPNAVDGMVHLLFIDRRGGQEVRRFNDTVGDFGDCFASTQRSILARGEPLENSCGTWFCMVTASREAARKSMVRARLAA